MKEKSNKTALWAILSVLVAATAFVSALFLNDMTKLNNAYADLNSIEFLSSSTQRLVRLAVTDQMDEKYLFSITDTSESTLQFEQKGTLSVMEHPEIAKVAQDVLSNWEKLEALLKSEDPSENSLILAGDNHFHSMTDLSNQVGDYTVSLNESIRNYQAIVSFLLFSMGLVLLNHLLRTHTELSQSKLLAAKAQIDVATGLYNRSRCQELFKSNTVSAEKKQPAILVLDLNDLKKTNDSQGHRVGDELIHAFADVLKNAAVVHVVPPFIGRYGGDEFIVFYDDIQGESDISVFMKELKFLTDNFNEHESRFQISYALGYCFLPSTSEEKLSIRQLFDKADEAMYENKIASKRAKNPNYDEEVKRGEVR